MWEQFWVQNTHYILEVFVAFMMITAAWIYLDGWLVERKVKTFIRSLGFFILALWSFLGAVPSGFSQVVAAMTDPVGIVGFGLVFASLLIDPVPVKPDEKPIRFFSKFWEKYFALLPLGLDSVSEQISRVLNRFVPLVAALQGTATLLLAPKIWIFVFSAFTAFLLWLHYSKGIQREWKFFYLGFLSLTLSAALAVPTMWQESANVLLAQLLAPYHVVWVLEHIVKLVGAALLAVWAWGFIRFRIFPQIFSSFIALSFFIFLVMTILYTGFLLGRTQTSAISDLETNVKTFDFALQKVKESAILAARIAAVNPQVHEAVRRDDKDALFKNLNALMFENETDFMLAINIGGEVLMRAEDKDRFGDSIADDPVVWRALDGKAVVTTAVEQGVAIPKVMIRASSPIVDTSEEGEPEIVGAIVTGFLLDNAFVDGIRKITGLDVAVFANDIRSASTFTVPGSEFRLIGTRETDQRILTTVLKERRVYTGTATILNQSYLAAYIPIEDVEETVVGMFFTGRSQSSIIALAGETIQLTFVVSLLLMVVSVFPLRWLARFITRHQEV